MLDSNGVFFGFIVNFHCQTMFTRLYKSGSSMEGGTLVQLRNLLNRFNISSDISSDISGKFNAAINFLNWW